MDEIMQYGAFQIKAVIFQIAEHFFNPHPALIKAHWGLQVWQIGGQKPELFYLPVSQ
jgi:hypothetical protein